MDLHQLKVFLVVAEHLHFGNAAKELHLAQPAVSRSVAQLEKSLGTPLFERSTRRVSLTPAGIQLVESGRSILDKVSETKALVQAAEDGDRGRISIVFAGASTHQMLAALCHEINVSYPRISTRIQPQVYTQHSLNMVLEGEMDIELGRWDFLPAGLEDRAVVREHLVLAVHMSHPLAQEESVWFSQVADEPFVGPVETRTLLNDRLQLLSHAAGFEPHIVQRAPELSTALTMVAAGIGVTLTLNTLQDNVNDDYVRFIPVADDYPPIYLRMAWRPDSTNPVLRHALEAANRVWPEIDVDAP
ncbi:MAG: LysR family transcriptional regulator [Micrococcaceae bacterium]